MLTHALEWLRLPSPAIPDQPHEAGAEEEQGGRFGDRCRTGYRVVRINIRKSPVDWPVKSQLKGVALPGVELETSPVPVKARSY